MLELFHLLLDWVAAHPLWSGLVIFLVAMSESLAIVGLIVPGVMIMFGIGALIASGAIAFWPALGWAVAGAVVGDGLSFWLGRHFSDRLTRIWPFSRHPQTLERGIAFFERYGGKSVAFGRFFGPVRAVIPLVAGAMGMRPLRFLAANVLSALAWAPAYLLPGIVFGASLELASEVAFRLVLLLLLLVLFLWLVLHLLRTLFRLLHPHAGRWVEALLRWSRLHPKLGEIAAALADPAHPEAKGLSTLASLLVLTTLLFTLILGAVLDASAISGLDHTVLNALQSLRSPWADHLMTALTRLTDTNTLAGLSLGVLAYLAWRGHRRTLLYWLAAIGFAILVPSLLKNLLQIPRPDMLAIPPGSYSFPSGHTLKATVLYGFLSVMIARPIHSGWRWIPYAAAALAAGGVALSRLYLGVHWLSDVLGSLCLGLAWVALLAIAYNRHTRPETHWAGLAGASLLILGVTLAVETHLHHSERVARYQPAREPIRIQRIQWWQDPQVAGQPGYREDTQSRHDHPLNIQFAGAPADLEQALHERGWRRAGVLSWENLLRLLSPSLPLAQMPVLPQVHNARHEALVLERADTTRGRLVLRLWPTRIRLSPTGQPLWIGNVSHQEKRVIAASFSFATTGGDFHTPLARLIEDLQDSRLPHRVHDGLLWVGTPDTTGTAVMPPG
ncbi:MAG: phosphatase PAP2 family protein [Candidatus Sedimenticola endophacoides]